MWLFNIFTSKTEVFVITLTFCKATTAKKQIKEFEWITDNFVIKEITSGFLDFSESHLIKVLSAFSLLRAGGSFGQQRSGFRSSVRPVLINTQHKLWPEWVWWRHTWHRNVSHRFKSLSSQSVCSSKPFLSWSFVSTNSLVRVQKDKPSHSHLLCGRHTKCDNCQDVIWQCSLTPLWIKSWQHLMIVTSVQPLIWPGLTLVTCLHLHALNNMTGWDRV